jgi:hypothetical protein
MGKILVREIASSAEADGKKIRRDGRCHPGIFHASTKSNSIGPPSQPTLPQVSRMDADVVFPALRPAQEFGKKLLPSMSNPSAPLSLVHSS